MEWHVWVLLSGWLFICGAFHFVNVDREKLRADRDRWRRKAEWLVGEAVRALKQFERIGGVIDDGPVTKELILKAADEAVEEDDDGLS